MSRFWSAVVHGLSPYVPGEQPKQDGLIKLNTNENPYPPSPHVQVAISTATDRLHLYPDPRATALREAIAAYHDVAPEEVFAGNGSDEVLAHTFQALLKHDAPLLFPDITYSFFSFRSGPSFMASVTRRCRSMPPCGSRSPTTGSRAARSFCPIRTRRPALACRATRSSGW